MSHSKPTHVTCVGFQTRTRALSPTQQVCNDVLLLAHSCCCCPPKQPPIARTDRTRPDCAVHVAPSRSNPAVRLCHACPDAGCREAQGAADASRVVVAGAVCASGARLGHPAVVAIARQVHTGADGHKPACAISIPHKMRGRVGKLRAVAAGNLSQGAVPVMEKK